MTESTFMKENFRPSSFLSSFSHAPHHPSTKDLLITDRQTNAIEIEYLASKTKSLKDHIQRELDSHALAMAEQNKQLNNLQKETFDLLKDSEKEHQQLKQVQETTSKLEEHAHSILGQIRHKHQLHHSEVKTIERGCQAMSSAIHSAKKEAGTKWLSGVNEMGEQISAMSDRLAEVEGEGSMNLSELEEEIASMKGNIADMAHRKQLAREHEASLIANMLEQLIEKMLKL